MSKHFPSLAGIWNTFNFVLAVCCLIPSAILGPGVTLVYYTLGPNGSPATWCKENPDYCTLYTYLVYIVWIFFFASLLQFLACWFKSICLLHCSIGLYVLDGILSTVLCTKYLVSCTLFDRKCLTHETDDVFYVTNLFVVNLFYLLLIGTVIFFMFKYSSKLRSWFRLILKSRSKHLF